MRNDFPAGTALMVMAGDTGGWAPLGSSGGFGRHGSGWGRSVVGDC
ncbi:hypothetical protein ACWENQ_44960 [Nonomuraea sp. NPDC004354]